MVDSTKEGLWAKLEPWIWTLVAVFFIRAFLVQSYVVPSGSMENTLLPGDFLLAAKFTYGLEIPYTGIKLLQLKKPRRGEVVVFKYPLAPVDYVKRVVAVAGDTVEIRDKVLYVNGVPQEEPYVIHTDSRVIPNDLGIPPPEFQRLWEERKLVENYSVRDNFGPVVVPEGCCFVMGDNRDASSDSRFWGPLPYKNLKGTPLIIFFSWDSNGPWWRVWERIRWRRLLRILIWS